MLLLNQLNIYLFLLFLMGKYSEVAVDRVSTTESQTLKTGSGPKMTVLGQSHQSTALAWLECLLCLALAWSGLGLSCLPCLGLEFFFSENQKSKLQISQQKNGFLTNLANVHPKIMIQNLIIFTVINGTINQMYSWRL